MRSVISVAARPFAAALVLLPVAVPAVAADGGMPVVAYLDADSVPGGGDTTGYADFNGRIDAKSSQFCYTLVLEDLAMTGAAIHEGKEGKAGAAVFALEAGEGGKEVCTSMDSKLAKAIGGKPGNYYVSINSAAFPAGALRGQIENDE